MQGKTVLITGASRGIGAEAGRVFAAAGANVALVARSRDQIDALAAALGDNAIALACDVSDFAQVRAGRRGLPGPLWQPGRFDWKRRGDRADLSPVQRGYRSLESGDRYQPQRCVLWHARGIAGDAGRRRWNRIDHILWRGVEPG